MNDAVSLRDFALNFPETTEESPFGPETGVYKVAGKMFATLSPEAVPVAMNLKCNPDKALELRETYEAIHPGYHMNKQHWNTVLLDGSLEDKFIESMILDSYHLVVAGHKKEIRDRLKKSLCE